MKDSMHRDEEASEENDPVWDLLSRDAKNYPIAPSPWFATRVAAKALAIHQQGTRSLSTLIRWLVPIPVACSALLAFAAWNHHRDAEEKFEQHMEFLASSDYDYEV
jgi:hypothetical protein